MDRIRLALIHLIARAVGVNMAYEIRFLSANLSKASTTGLLIKSFSSPTKALADMDQNKTARSHPYDEGHYFIQIKARI